MLTDPKTQIKYDNTNLFGHAFPAARSAAGGAAAAQSAAARAADGALRRLDAADGSTAGAIKAGAADFDGAKACLSHLYGPGLKAASTRSTKTPTTAPATAGGSAGSSLIPFDQTSFTPQGAGWADQGLLYIPAACNATPTPPTGCSLHVMLHDCGTRENPTLPAVGTMTKAEQAFAAYADTNAIVLFMPRLTRDPNVKAVDVGRGCWDVFGQLGHDYARQSSPHLHPLLPMMQAITSGSFGGGAGGGRGSSNSGSNGSSGSSIKTNRGHRHLGSSSSSSSNVAVKDSTEPLAAPYLEGGGAAARTQPPRAVLHLPRIRVDPSRIFSHGISSGGDMAVQFHVGFSKHVKGVCASDAQPWRCAATRFDGDVMLPQTPESSTPHCFGCDEGKTLLYDHCKSHASYVNASMLAAAAAAAPSCASTTATARGVPGTPPRANARSGSGSGGGDCIDSVANLEAAKIFLTRSECRTYTGSAVENTRDVYAALGAKGMQYFDQCNPDGSHRKNDTIAMCLEHVFGFVLCAALHCTVL